MFKVTLLWIGVIVGLVAVAGLVTAGAGSEKKAEIRVGVFDSRAVAVAFAHSQFQRDIIKAKKAELDQAKAAGDGKKVEELEAWGKTNQKKLHGQGFGAASVKDLLEPVKDSLPKIAQAAGVQMIASKWDVVYQSPEAELVDITGEIIKPFQPSDKVLKMIGDLHKHAPISEAELEKLEKSHSH